MSLYDNNNVTITHGASGQQITITSSDTNNNPTKPEKEMLFARSGSPSKREVKSASGRASRKRWGWERMLQDPQTAKRQSRRSSNGTISSKGVVHAPLDLS